MGAALWLPQCRSLERLTGCNLLSRHGWQPSTVALAVWLVLAWLAVAIRARCKGLAPVAAAMGLESNSGLPWGLQERREATGQLTGQTATASVPMATPGSPRSRREMELGDVPARTARSATAIPRRNLAFRTSWPSRSSAGFAFGDPITTIHI